MTDHPDIEYVVVEQSRRSIWRRPGCLLGLLLWMVFLMLPLGLFILAIEGDITIYHGGGVPERLEHPRLQIRLVSEIDYRGLNVNTSSVNRSGSNTMCIQTDVRYLLWQGDGEAATYCDCYGRSDTESAWVFESTAAGQCD